MFDYSIATQPHFEDACRHFAVKHNLTTLARKAGIRPQVLRNKLNPEQPHQLTANEVMRLTDISGDPTLVDGFLAQMHCLPCVPVNEMPREKIQVYTLKATAELGQIAAGALATEQLCANRRRSLVENVNAGIRYLSLAALTMHARLQANPAISNTLDSVSGLGASFGVI